MPVVFPPPVDIEMAKAIAIINGHAPVEMSQHSYCGNFLYCESCEYLIWHSQTVIGDDDRSRSSSFARYLRGCEK